MNAKFAMNSTLHSIEGAPPAGTTGGNPAMISQIASVRCDKCHGPTSAGVGGIYDIENIYSQMAAGRIVAGHPELSSFYQMAAGKGPCGPAIPSIELQTISDYITALSPMTTIKR